MQVLGVPRVNIGRGQEVVVRAFVQFTVAFGRGGSFLRLPGREHRLFLGEQTLKILEQLPVRLGVAQHALENCDRFFPPRARYSSIQRTRVDSCP